MTKAEQLALIERLLAAASLGDAVAMAEQYTEDVLVEFPYADPPAHIAGKDAAIRRLSAAFKAFSISVIPQVIHRVDDATVIVEGSGTGTYLPTGHRYDNSYVIVYTFRDGLISGQREYFNPVPVARAVG